MQIPLECRLDASSAIERVEEWRRLLSDQVTALERPAPHCLRLRLRDTTDALIEATELAERETSCCSFFGFSIELVRGRWLVITVPPEASGVLGDLAGLGLAPTDGSPPASARPGGGA